MLERVGWKEEFMLKKKIPPKGKRGPVANEHKRGTLEAAPPAKVLRQTKLTDMALATSGSTASASKRTADTEDFDMDPEDLFGDEDLEGDSDGDGHTEESESGDSVLEQPNLEAEEWPRFGRICFAKPRSREEMEAMAKETEEAKAEKPEEAMATKPEETTAKEAEEATKPHTTANDQIERKATEPRITVSEMSQKIVELCRQQPLLVASVVAGLSAPGIPATIVPSRTPVIEILQGSGSSTSPSGSRTSPSGSTPKALLDLKPKEALDLKPKEAPKEVHRCEVCKMEMLAGEELTTTECMHVPLGDERSG